MFISDAIDAQDRSNKATHFSAYDDDAASHLQEVAGIDVGPLRWQYCRSKS